MRFLSFLIAILFLNLVYERIVAQEYSYTHYDTKDGLAGSTVHGMAQTKDGFIWFGTETGLSCFDGSSFKTFSVEEGLPANEILTLFSDSRGRLWLLPFKKTVSYYEKGKIHTKENDTMLRKLELNSLPGIAESNKGDIILQDYDGIRHNYLYVIPKDDRVYKLPGSFFTNGRYIVPFPNQYGIIFTNHGLPSDMTVLPDVIRRQVLPDWRLKGTLKKGDTIFYVFRDTKKMWILNEKKSIERVFQEFSDVQILNDHQIIISKRFKGVEIIDIADPYTAVNYFPDYIVHAVMQDIEGNLWFSTKGSGVFKISSNRFMNLFTVNQNGTTYIGDIHKIGKDIFVGGFNNRCWKIRPAEEQHFQRAMIDKPIPFHIDKTFLNRIPYGTFIHTGSADFLNLKRIGLDSLLYTKTVQVLGDTLLIASQSGVILFPRKQTKAPEWIFKGRATCAYRQGKDYYIGTLEGLYHIGPGRRIQYLGDRFSEFRKEISSMAEGKDGTLWIGSNGSGVWGYKNRAISATFSRENGLVSNLCRCLFTQDNELWVGTEKGLNKIDITPGVGRVESTITANDGLNSNIVNAICRDGNFVYVGTPVGVTVFDERNIKMHGISYLNMTGITVSGRKLDPWQADIRLDHKDNNISFTYSGISFLSEGNIIYRYRIRGLDENWKETREQTLSYPSLPSGAYILELIAINKYGDRSKPLLYSFTIEQSLIEKPWFRIVITCMAVFLIALIIYAFIQARHKRTTKDLMLQHKIISLEQMALRAQMNPHFIFNCLNSIQEYILHGDIKKTNFYLTRFAALIRDTFNNAAKVEIPLEQEVNYLKAYIDLEQMKQSESFDYEIKIDPQIDPQNTQIPNMVLQPYVENAIKHGVKQAKGRGRLNIDFNLYPEKSLLECIIEDNGPGIEYTRQQGVVTTLSLSQSMTITNKRILTLNQLDPGKESIKLQIIDKKKFNHGNGTKIILLFPTKLT